MNEEIQNRITNLLDTIASLEYQNSELYRNISILEEGNCEVVSLRKKWTGQLSSCFTTVKSCLSNLDPNSGFREFYMDELSAILSGKEAVEIEESLNTLNIKSKAKIEELEDDIKRNMIRIRDYQYEINELRLQLTAEVT